MATIFYNDSYRYIREYDTDTEESEVLVRTDRALYDLAYTQGTFYGVDTGGGRVYSIDMSSGQTTLLASSAVFLNALTADADGNLYAAGRGNQNLYQITAGGEISVLANIGSYAEGDLTYLNNAIYMTNTARELVKYDLETSEVTTVATGLPYDLYGLTVLDENTLIGLEDDGDVWNINLDTGDFEKTDRLSHYGQVHGAAVEPIATTPLNTEPEAVDDSAAGEEDTAVVIATAELLANDTDAEGDTLSIVSVQGAVNGTVELFGAGIDSTSNVVFTPAAGYAGPASFTYTIADGQGGLDTATVNLTIEADNQAPVAVDDTATAIVDTPLVILIADLLANDSDPDGDDIYEFGVQDAQNGIITVEAGEITFAPTAGYVGPASFTYTITDGLGGFSTATVNLTVEPELIIDPPPGNEAPVAVDDTIAPTLVDALITITPAEILGNDYDPEGDEVIGVDINNAINGIVYYEDGNVFFLPNAGYEGPASFDYVIQDSQGLESTGTVNMTIEAQSVIEGTEGDDTINGTTADEVIYGLAGDDLIFATDGDDTIIGGLGSDTLYGEAGADTFVWGLEDINLFEADTDTIIGGEVEDKIDISDLLQGEETLDVDQTKAEKLDEYLNISTNDDGDTVIEINANGNFADPEATVDQIIVIEGFDLTAGNTLTDVETINNLLPNFIVD